MNLIVKRKRRDSNPHILSDGFRKNGWCRIRTHGTLQYERLVIACLRPLSQPSQKLLKNGLRLYPFVTVRLLDYQPVSRPTFPNVSTLARVSTVIAAFCFAVGSAMSLSRYVTQCSVYHRPCGPFRGANPLCATFHQGCQFLGNLHPLHSPCGVKPYATSESGFPYSHATPRATFLFGIICRD